MNGYGLIVLVSLLTCAGQLCQKQAATRWQTNPPRPDRRVAALCWLLAAMGLLAIALALWLRVLQLLPLSLAYPMLSFNFVLVTLASHWCFGEPVAARHWWGVASIMLGIMLLSITP